MTCIVGIVKDGVTYLGGDTLGSNGHSGSEITGSKVFHVEGKEDIIIGYTTSFRMGQLLEFSTDLIEIEAYESGKINREYLIRTFSKKLVELFKDFEGFDEKEGGVFLIGIGDKLYEIQSDYSILENTDGYASCGSGEDFALGALKALEDFDIDPMVKLDMALKSASKFCTSVGGRNTFVCSSNMLLYDDYAYNEKVSKED